MSEDQEWWPCAWQSTCAGCEIGIRTCAAGGYVWDVSPPVGYPVSGASESLVQAKKRSVAVARHLKEIVALTQVTHGE